MNSASSVKTSLVRVLCESCIRARDADCELCGGTRFYFWDPATSFCYSDSGVQLVTKNDYGEVLNIVRSEGRRTGSLAVAEMLEMIERWVTESPVRKWKLILDDTKWQSCLWFNRYKKSCFQASERTFEACIERTFVELLKREPSWQISRRV